MLVDDEYNVYEANPDDEIESDPVPPKKNYSADIPEPTYSNGHHVREPYSNRYYPNYDTERHKEKAYTSSSSRKKEASPVRDYYNTTIHDATPPESPGAATKKRRPSPKRAKSSGGASKKTTESNVKYVFNSEGASRIELICVGLCMILSNTRNRPRIPKLQNQ